eukprot:SAG11_NODE_91_length_17102_cov_37.671343_6_plen_226_part_00
MPTYSESAYSESAYSESAYSESACSSPTYSESAYHVPYSRLRHEFARATNVGVTAHNASQRDEAARIGVGLAIGDCVAVFTNDTSGPAVDMATRARPFWLGKVTATPTQCIEATTCANSGVRFGVGESFISVEWFERASAHERDDNIFGAHSERGEYMVPVSVLRGGGTVLPIELIPLGWARARRSRRGGAAPQHQFFSLALETADAIGHKIEVEFQDDITSLSE